MHVNLVELYHLNRYRGKLREESWHYCTVVNPHYLVNLVLLYDEPLLDPVKSDA